VTVCDAKWLRQQRCLSLPCAGYFWAGCSSPSNIAGTAAASLVQQQHQWPRSSRRCLGLSYFVGVRVGPSTDC